MPEAEYDCQESELAPPATFRPVLLSPRRTLDSTPDILVDGPPRTSCLASPGVRSSDASSRSGCASSTAGAAILLSHYKGEGRYPQGKSKQVLWWYLNGKVCLLPLCSFTVKGLKSSLCVLLCVSLGFLLSFFHLFWFFSFHSLFFFSYLNTLQCVIFLFLCAFIAPWSKHPLHSSLTRVWNYFTSSAQEEGPTVLEWLLGAFIAKSDY